MCYTFVVVSSICCLTVFCAYKCFLLLLSPRYRLPAHSTALASNSLRRCNLTVSSVGWCCYRIISCLGPGHASSFVRWQNVVDLFADSSFSCWRCFCMPRVCMRVCESMRQFIWSLSQTCMCEFMYACVAKFVKSFCSNLFYFLCFLITTCSHLTFFYFTLLFIRFSLLFYIIFFRIIKRLFFHMCKLLLHSHIQAYTYVYVYIAVVSLFSYILKSRVT